MNNICIVLVTNDVFFEKMLYTLQGILNYNYTGDICVVIGDDLQNSEKLNHPLLKNIIIKHFPDIKFTENFYQLFDQREKVSHWKHKTTYQWPIFQFHKFYLFSCYFKKWNYIFYIDSGSTIFSSIQPILNLAKPNTLLAHSDSYPQYIWKLETQFLKTEHLLKLQKKYNLDTDYFQSTIMYFDSQIINNDTFSNLKNLTEEYPNCKTNDQSILSLYFTKIKPCWEQIPFGDETTWYYDYILRPEKNNKPHIILKNF